MYHDDLLESLPLPVLYLCWYGSLWFPYPFSVYWHINRVWRQTLWCHEWIRRAASFRIWNLAGSSEPLLWFVCLLSKQSVVGWSYHGSHLFPCGSKQPFLVLWSVPQNHYVCLLFCVVCSVALKMIAFGCEHIETTQWDHQVHSLAKPQGVWNPFVWAQPLPASSSSISIVRSGIMKYAA